MLTVLKCKPTESVFNSDSGAKSLVLDCTHISNIDYTVIQVCIILAFLYNSRISCTIHAFLNKHAFLYCSRIHEQSRISVQFPHFCTNPQFCTNPHFCTIHVFMNNPAFLYNSCISVQTRISVLANPSLLYKLAIFTLTHSCTIHAFL